MRLLTPFWQQRRIDNVFKDTPFMVGHVMVSHSPCLHPILRESIPHTPDERTRMMEERYI